jgi:hypothetical protein
MKTMIIPALLEIRFCPAIGSTGFYEMLMQFGLNLLVLLVISRVIYYRWNHKPEYMFAQLITGVVVFMICAMLHWVQLGMGLVLGLFAIFSIIRFRTVNVPIKEMTYLFMAVGISAVNALMQLDNCLQWILFANILVVGMTLLMERIFFNKKLNRRTITYDNTDLLKPSKHMLLMQALKELTELNIVRLEIGRVDYIKKHAQIRIYFTGEGSENFNDGENENSDD